MHLYHPVMFVGLGGTGCRIGAELERRLREELCGADGLKLHGPDFNLQELQAFQLPSCLQFLYADLSEDEMARLRRRSVPNEEYADVASRNAYYAYDLLPQFNSYPEVAKNLRVRVRDQVRDWLPSAEHEPMVTPLRVGAGQLPTVGRAALFETVSGGIDIARRPITDAIGKIKNSAGELRKLNRDLTARMEPIDVFVAFSVAGGTGAGIFYDYLHIIESAFAKEHLKANVYPLVLMPSAFDEGKGGGLYAALNAGRALLDLFRLIDDVNVDQRSHGELVPNRDRGGLHVTYPDEVIEMTLGSAQTAFLFSKSAGIDRDDLHRSVVALILSLVGLEQPKSSQSGGGDQSFAASFINSSINRQALARTKIGSQAVSTSLVGSLTVPFDDLADMFAGRLLARGVRELLPAPPGRAESNRDHIKNFFMGANVGAIWERAAAPFQDPAAVKGATEIMRTLQQRLKRMAEGLDSLDQDLVRRTPDLAKDFNPSEGGLRVLGDIDVFRLKRVVCGDPALTEDIDQRGVEGVMEIRRTPPTPANKDLGVNPPPLTAVKNRIFKKAHFSDPVVRSAIEQQNEWYRYRTNRCWHAAWNEHRGRWHGQLDRFVRHLRALVDELADHENNSEEVFSRRADELYRTRVGVTYLLPPRTELEHTYELMLRRLVAGFAAKRLRPNATEGEIVAAMLGPDGWREALSASLTTGQGPEYGVRIILARLKQEVVKILRDGGDGDGPLLPHMRHLLSSAAKRTRDVPVAESDVQSFVATLSGMIPAAFVPEGTGRLSVLVVYPADTGDAETERFLAETLRLPQGKNIVPTQFQWAEPEAITVVFVRSGMGVTEVSELRSVLRTWADAVKAPKSDYYLPWRQRLGFDQDWLATTEAHRIQILQRMLAAMWNGQFAVTGDRDSPESVRISLDAGDSGSEKMRLDLTPFGASSSWGSLLRAYEEWTLADGSEVRLNFCGELMESMPNGFSGRLTDPDPLYLHFVNTLAGREIKVLSEMRERMPASSRRRCEQLISFWESTVTSARDRTFLGEAPNGDSLRELEYTCDLRGGRAGEVR
ncbi:hypothetical protein F4553_006530 [Allocatelliglobosispora scoriae]|uniref:Tubulin-like protein n=1 Tax=Allocatelliglobosispora scoriae TaxID=643052 RepID=A0A841BZS6_9ACTN|nr:tubulin-like doman-containing protein [Allocatelliglobosispora scoriae]MBB5873096.1 hypothetical protein [Allocatelliglobosispora scoriae]